MLRSGAPVSSVVLAIVIAGWPAPQASGASVLPEHVIVVVESDVRNVPRWLAPVTQFGLLPVHREWQRAQELSHMLSDVNVMSELAHQTACPGSAATGDCHGLSVTYDKDLEAEVARLEASGVLLMRILRIGLLENQTSYEVIVRFDLVSTRPRPQVVKSFYAFHVENIDFEEESLEGRYRESLADISSMASYMIHTDWRGRHRKQPGAWTGLPTLQKLKSTGFCAADATRRESRWPVVRNDGRRVWLGDPTDSYNPAILVSLERTDCEPPEEE